MIGDPKQWRLEAAHKWLKRAAKLESDLLEQQKNVPDEVQNQS
jgi:hypothetical protein